MKKIKKARLGSLIAALCLLSIGSSASAGPLYLKKLKEAIPDSNTREFIIIKCVEDPDCYLVNGLPPKGTQNLTMSTDKLLRVNSKLSR